MPEILKDYFKDISENVRQALNDTIKGVHNVEDYVGSSHDVSDQLSKNVKSLFDKISPPASSKEIFIAKIKEEALLEKAKIDKLSSSEEKESELNKFKYRLLFKKLKELSESLDKGSDLEISISMYGYLYNKEVELAKQENRPIKAFEEFVGSLLSGSLYKDQTLALAVHKNMVKALSGIFQQRYMYLEYVRNYYLQKYLEKS